MKKLILTTITIVGLSIATFANNTTYTLKPIDGELKVTELEGLKFKVNAISSSESFVLKIKDIKGEVLFQTVVTESNYTKVFDLSSLPDGSYEWVIDSGKESKIKTFEIKTVTIRSANGL